MRLINPQPEARMLQQPRPAIVVMAKAPRAGEVKTRLTPPLTHAEAADLAACFVRDTFATARRVAREAFVAYTPADGRAPLEELLPGHDLFIEQRGADLGARLSAVIAEASARGLGPLLVVGADSPTLPREFLSEALRALAAGEADIALGPVEDGGYYAVAVPRPVEGLFDGVAWSTARAYEGTAENAERLGLKILRLPAWYDIDTREDLNRLREEFSKDEAARRRAPETYRWTLSTPAR